jgi:hypothetical protein
MAVTQITTRDTMLEAQRIGFDATMLENDGGTVKVSVGSVVEIAGALYVVDTAAETPTGTPADGEYLYFTGTGFVWSSTAGSYDAELGAIYNGANRRCRFRLSGATTWDQLVAPEAASGVRFPGNAHLDTLETEHGIEPAGVAFDVPPTTIGALFSTLSNVVPNTGDSRLVTGGVCIGNVLYVGSSIQRASATRIYLRLIGVNGGFSDPIIKNIDQGDGTAIYANLAW